MEADPGDAGLHELIAAVEEITTTQESADDSVLDHIAHQSAAADNHLTFTSPHKQNQASLLHKSPPRQYTYSVRNQQNLFSVQKPFSPQKGGVNQVS